MLEQSVLTAVPATARPDVLYRPVRQACHTNPQVLVQAHVSRCNCNVPRCRQVPQWVEFRSVSQPHAGGQVCSHAEGLLNKGV